MSYKAWERAFVNAVTSDRAWASKWNLDNETRVNRRRGAFRRWLGARFERLVGEGCPPGKAALRTFEERIEAPSKDWRPLEGLLPLLPDSVLPMTTYVTYTCASDAARYGAAAHIDPDNPPATFRFSKAHMTNSNGNPAKRFIWVSFEPGGGSPTNDPTEVVRVMGLDHFPRGDFVYRLSLNVDRSRLRPPSAFDARLNPAWAPPPRGYPHPWGTTRDLEKGTVGKPELLSETADHLAERPRAQLVSPPGRRERVTGIAVDYRAGR